MPELTSFPLEKPRPGVPDQWSYLPPSFPFSYDRQPGDGLGSILTPVFQASLSVMDTIVLLSLSFYCADDDARFRPPTFICQDRLINNEADR